MAGKTKIEIKINEGTIREAGNLLRTVRSLFTYPGAQRSETSCQAPSIDPYTVLGLPRNATARQIKSRYTQLSKVFHPDLEGGHNEAMKRLNSAYEEILRERGLRK